MHGNFILMGSFNMRKCKHKFVWVKLTNGYITYKSKYCTKCGIYKGDK